MVFKTLFGDLLGGKDGDSPNDVPWKAMDSPEVLDSILGDRNSGLLVVFKHSTSCGLSSMMLRRFESRWRDAPADLYLLDVRRHRELSDRLSRELACRHESPQALLLRDGQLLAHASHGDIPGLAPSDYA